GRGRRARRNARRRTAGAARSTRRTSIPAPSHTGTQLNGFVGVAGAAVCGWSPPRPVWGFLSGRSWPSGLFGLAGPVPEVFGPTVVGSGAYAGFTAPTTLPAGVASNIVHPYPLK